MTKTGQRAIGRRHVLAAAAAGAVAAGPAGAAASVPSLKASAAKKGIQFGTMIRQAWLDAGYSAAILRDCAIVTPGIEAKWWNTEQVEGRYTLAELDLLGSELRARGVQWRLHNLVWSQWNPVWLASALAAGRGEAVLTRHIGTLVKRYAGVTAAWDVVNEPADPRWPCDPTGLMMTPWWHALGPRYVDLAFHVAHAADPEALLFVNDDYFEYPQSAAKRATYLRLVESWLKRGVPVHGFGIQAHLRPDMAFDVKPYRAFLRELGAMGLTIHITEMDVVDATLPANVALRDRIVADTAARFLDVALDEPAVKAVVTWGLADQFTGMDQEAPRRDGLPTRGAPLDRAYQPKPLWSALSNAFAHAPLRS